MTGLRRIACLIGLVAAALLSGCATGVDYAQAERSLATLSPDRGRIYFYRDSSMVGAAIQPLIYLNGQQVGRSQPGGYFVVDVMPGTHVATSTTEAEARATLDVGPGRTVYVSSSIGLGFVAGRISFIVQPEATGRAALTSLKLTSTPGSSASLMPASRASSQGSPGPTRLGTGPLTMDDLAGLLPPRR